MLFLVLVCLWLQGVVAAPAGQIAFMREGRVWLINTDGTGQRPLTDTLFYKTERPLCWAPDGSRLLYWNHSNVGWDIWSLGLSGEMPRNLTTTRSGGCRSPSWSPDSKRIAYMRDEPEGLYLMNADGSDSRRLTMHGFRDESPAWSPDGRKIAYTRLTSEGPEKSVLEIFVFDLATRREVRIVQNGSSPAWSREGRKLLFVRQQSGRTAILLCNPDGSRETALTDSPGLKEQPTWSPDGSRIAYVEYRDNKAALVMMEREGRNSVRLAEFEERIWQAPSWSSDGRWITVAAGSNGKQAVYVIGVEDRRRRPLTGNGACFPVWRPDQLVKDAPEKERSRKAPAPRQ